MIDTARQVSTDEEQRKLSFYNALSECGVDIDRTGVTDEGGISLEYSIEDGDSQDAIGEVNAIVGAFLGAQENNELGGLEATVYDDEGGTATWHVKAEWVKKYQIGEWDGDRIIEAVFDSMEVN